MRKQFWMGVLAVILCGNVYAQSEQKSAKSRKGIFYFEGGSHRSFYTKSDIHLRREGDPSFDMTLLNVKGRDEGGLRFHTAPQFTYAVGYYFKNKGFGLEYHYDHIKYFVRQGQVVRMKGTINGQKFDQDTTINPSFLKLEHSDGGNYAMINIVKWIPLVEDKRGRFILNLTAKAGFGVVNPKTNSTIMGQHRDDKYHISGIVTGVETGFRFNFLKHFVASTTFKGTYASYSDILIAGGRGSQKWFAAQFIYQLGAQFPL